MRENCNIPVSLSLVQAVCYDYSMTLGTLINDQKVLAAILAAIEAYLRSSRESAK
jgi:hypothetical protein